MSALVKRKINGPQMRQAVYRSETVVCRSEEIATDEHDI